MRSFLLSVGFLTTCLSGTYAAGPPPTEAAIRALVEQLASPNQRPKAYPESAGSPDAKFPLGYDPAAQSKVRQAFLELQKIGPRAFPYLAEKIDDKRYSFTDDAGEVMSNWSVGSACYDIIDSQVQAYNGMWNGTADDGDPRERPRRPTPFQQDELEDSSKFRTWCEVRKHKTLRELQIESLEWTIAEEAKRPQSFSDVERKHLQDVLTKLRASNQPLPPASRWAR
jgi:hypothetical protein